MGFRVQATDERPAMQDRQCEVAINSLGRGRVAFQPVIKTKHFTCALSIPNKRVKGREQCGQGRLKLTGSRSSQQLAIVWMDVGRLIPSFDLQTEQRLLLSQ